MPKKCKKNKFNLFGIIFVIFCFAFCVVCADLFSGIITAGNFSINLSTQTKSTQYYLYGVYTTKSQIKSEAESLAGDVKAQSGAGYVLEYGGSYYVMLSAYLEENDANKVVKSLLSNSNLTSYVLKIDIENIDISGTLSSNSSSVLLSSIATFKYVYEKLYDISVAYDTDISNASEVKTNIAVVVGYVEKQKSAFDNEFSSKLTGDLIQIKLALAELYDKLEDIYENVTDNATLSSSIKCAYFDAVVINIKLCSSINKSY